jgi:copper homeostasis protein
MKIVKEACVETYNQAILAEKNGANRIELCGDLSVGGVTPEVELTQRLLDVLTIPIMVMVRPRGGNFVYSDEEFAVMKTTILTFKKMGVAGVVFGILKEDFTINLEQTKALALLAKPLKVTFHKAIDACSDTLTEFSKLLTINEIDIVLTSGGEATAKEGIPVLKEMINLSAGKITVLSAGKITDKNLAELHHNIAGTAYHGRKIVGDLTF